MVIRISGPARVSSTSGKPLSQSALRKLNGAESDDAVSNYFAPDLADLGITGGTVKLVHDKTAGHFRVVTEFASPAKVPPAKLKRLVAETLGQWSDGIGEGCFDDLARRLGVEIDLASIDHKRDLAIEQIDDGVVVRRPATALVKAAREGKLSKVRELLDAGADIETKVQGSTALHEAVLSGHAAVSLELIRRGADVRAPDSMGEDPLMLTALSNQITDADAAQIAEALLERGAGVYGPRGRDANPRYGEYTPLYMAKNRKKSKLAAVLRRFGATK